MSFRAAWVTEWQPIPRQALRHLRASNALLFDTNVSSKCICFIFT